jgi:twitching motility two-component system response regulator PilG
MGNGLKTVLMVDDERSFLMSAKEGIEFYSNQFNVLTAFNGNEALEVLDTGDVDLVVTDLKMPVMDGFELIAHISQKHKQIPVLVMTAFGTPEIHNKVKDLGAMHYMEKPIGINDLLEKIVDTLSEKSTSRIHGFSLANFLQLVEIEEKTLALRVRSGRRMGHLYINGGVLVDAETEHLNGKEAAIEIINWDKTEIEILEGICRKKGSINASLMSILLEATKSIDEENFSATTEKDPLEKAVMLAEGHRFKEAQALLADYLKEHPGNYLAWLWYSRITGSMKHIDSALSNACKINPEDPLVNEELRKFKLALKKLGGGQYPRCPFCWTPVGEQSSHCFFCLGDFFVNPEALNRANESKQIVFIEAINRYSRILKREDSPRLRFYLAMAHFNLQNWEDAMDQLARVVKTAPEKKFYADQLQKFLNLMAATGTEISQPQLRDDDGAPAAGRDPVCRRKKVLVVEDSSTTRKVIAITLSQNGYDVVEARDGIEALNILNEDRPDLILLDIILPKMDGYKVLAIVKENPELKQTPVIMLTSRDGLINKVKGRMAGSTAYLTKPFNPQKLVDTIEKTLC